VGWSEGQAAKSSNARVKGEKDRKKKGEVKGRGREGKGDKERGWV
jgi:hypothetical protein